MTTKQQLHNDFMALIAKANESLDRMEVAIESNTTVRKRIVVNQQLRSERRV